MTADELDVMERMWAAGMPTADIARALGVSTAVVHMTAKNHRDRYPRRGSYSESASWPCGGCFLECEPNLNHTKRYPCELPMRRWAAEHRLDPGDELGYVWEVEQC